MKDRLFQEVKQFLDKRSPLEGPLLLGFSGGSDSMALLHLLMEYGSLNIHLAHVDHGWRAESEAQARWLQERFQLPFHLKRISVPGAHNLEARCRSERILFFQEVYQKIGATALLLAHHADDQAETVLKRVLEGAYMTALHGLKAETSLGEMRVWRPLLKISKKEIVTYVETRKIEAIHDPTNTSIQFLRGRMRTVLLPTLSEQFGKQVQENLCFLGESALEIKNYIDNKIAPLKGSFMQIEEGWAADLSKWESRDALEYKAFIRWCSGKLGFSLSREQLDLMTSWLVSNEKGKRLFKSGFLILVSNRTITIKKDCNKNSVLLK